MRKIFLIFILFLYLNNCFATASLKSTTKMPIILKVNGFFVCKSKNFSPYLDSQRNVIVSIDLLINLIGIQVEKVGPNVLFKHNNNAVLMSYNDKQIFSDGINLNHLSDRIKIKHYWNSSNQYVIEDKSLKETEMIKRFKDNESIDVNSFDNNSINIISYSNYYENNIEYYAYEGINAKNKTINKNLEDIHPIYFFSDGIMSTDNQSRPRKKSGKKIEPFQAVHFKHTQERMGSIEYILCLGRSLVQKESVK